MIGSMANEHGGMDGSAIDWSFAATQAYLPPRSPAIATGGVSNNSKCNIADGSNDVSKGGFFVANWSKPPQQGANGTANGGHHHHHHHHHRSPSTGFLLQTPAWVDDLLNDTPDVPFLKNNVSHRRSSSDSFAFSFDAPNLDVDHGQDECSQLLNVWSKPHNGTRTSTKANVNEVQSSNVVDANGSIQKHNSKTFQSISSSCIQTVASTPEKNPAAPIESSSSPSDPDSANASAHSMDDNKKNQGLGGQQHPWSHESEVQSALISEPASAATPSTTRKEETISATDALLLDTKRAKRILANRQSAQRSRVRKLQYISELERTVNILQEEVSALSPQVTYLDRQRIVLNVDNSSMKQRIAALAQDKIFKDAQNEALKNEVLRLRQLQERQQQKLSSSISQHHSGIQLMSQQQEAIIIKESELEYLLKEDETAMMRDNINVLPRSPLPKPIGPSSSSTCSTNEKDRGQTMQAVIFQLCHPAADFRVHNP